MNGQEQSEFKLLTLTLKSSSAPLPDRVALLLKSFRRLRSSRLWRAMNASGVGVVETTYKPETESWHAHLHCVMTARYVSCRELSKAWRVASKGSFIIDIRALRSKNANQDVANYVTSYITKTPTGVDPQNLPVLEAWVNALTSNHWIVGFGKRNVATSKPDQGEKPPKETWVSLGFLNDLLEKANYGDSRAVAIVAKLAQASETDCLLDPPDG
jgi:hypothetical protein